MVGFIVQMDVVTAMQALKKCMYSRGILRLNVVWNQNSNAVVVEKNSDTNHT